MTIQFREPSLYEESNMAKSRTTRASREPNVNAVILYEDFASAAKSSAILRRAAYRAHPAARCNFRPWRVDMLKMPSLAEEAVVEAATAQLIVFAGGFVQRPPSWLLAWLEQWAISRRFRNVALAIIGNQGSPQPPVLASLELSQFAKRHGLSLICDSSVVIR